MAFVLTNPVLLPANSQTGVYEPKDVSAYVPEGATGVMLRIFNASGAAKSYAIRKPGSTDDYYVALHPGYPVPAYIGLDANRSFELKLSALPLDVYLLGYFTSDAVFYTNGVLLTPSVGGSWQDVDTGLPPEAKFAIFDLIAGDSTVDAIGVRANGGTDEFQGTDSLLHKAAIIGVDGGGICEAFLEDIANGKLVLLGYIRAGAAKINGLNVTPPSAGLITDIDMSGDGPPMNASAALVIVGGTATNKWLLRKKGSSEIFYQNSPANSNAGVFLAGLDANKIFQGEVETLSVMFYVLGYLVDPASVSVNIPSQSVLLSANPASASIRSTVSVPSQPVNFILQPVTVISEKNVTVSVPCLIVLLSLMPLRFPESISRLRDRPRLKPVYLVQITLGNSGPVLYFSDRNIKTGFKYYEAYLKGINGIRNAGIMPGAELEFLNGKFANYEHLIEIGETYPFEGAECVIREAVLDDNDLPSESEILVKGFLEGPHDISTTGFKCRLSAPIAFKDRTWKQAVIDKTNYPNAYEDVGAVEPLVYGRDVLVPALRTDWGARTTLQASISDTAASLELSDGGRFPASGYFWIDGEKIFFTRSGNSCAITRAQGGTTARVHNAGADVWEERAQYDSLIASHEVQVKAIYAEMEGKFLRLTSGVSGLFTGGKHFLRATEQIKVSPVSDDLGIADNISIENYHEPQTRKVRRHATNLPLQMTASGNITFPSAPGGLLENIIIRLYFYVTSLASPSSELTVSCDGVTLAKVSTTNVLTSYVDIPFGKTSGTWLTSLAITITNGSSNTTITVFDAWEEADVTSAFDSDSAGGHVSSEATNLPLQFTSSGTITYPSAPAGVKTDIYEEIEYSVAILGSPASDCTLNYNGKKICTVKNGGMEFPYNGSHRFKMSRSSWITSGAFTVTNASSNVVWNIRRATQHCMTTWENSVSYASKLGTVALSGGVVGTRFVERFHALVDGITDPDGNYGGVGNVIERPDHLIKHFLVQKAGIPLSDIESASFTEAGTLYSGYVPGGYKYAFSVREKVKPSEFLSRLALECRSKIYFNSGKFFLHALSDISPAGIKIISGGELAGRFTNFKFRRMPLAELANDITASFRRNYSPGNHETAWLSTSKVSDPASQAKYGLYPLEVEFEFIREQGMADHLLAHMLLRQKAPLLRVEFPVFWEHFDLRPGDTIAIEDTLYNGRKFLIESIERKDPFRAVVKGTEWWG